MVTHNHQAVTYGSVLYSTENYYRRVKVCLIDYAYRSRQGAHQYEPKLLWYFEFDLCLACAELASTLRFAECRKCRKTQKDVLASFGFKLTQYRSLARIHRDPPELLEEAETAMYQESRQNFGADN